MRVEELGNFEKHWDGTCVAQVLLALQNRLTDCVGPLDHVHSLGEGEFLIVMRCSLMRALDRAAQIRIIINSPYPVEALLGTAEIEINSVIRGAEYIPGEDIASLKARAEQATRSGFSPSETRLAARLQQPG